MSDFFALYGGSYNLPTKTHYDIPVRICDKVKPDAVWCIVSPQNPSKSAKGMAPFDERMEMCRLNAADDTRIIITDVEVSIRERNRSTQTSDFLRTLQQDNPDTRFAWVMGADNFATMHTWDRYEYILGNHPIIVVPRLGHTEAALASVAATSHLTKRLDDHHPERLRHEHGWVLLDYPETADSATSAREALQTGRCPPHVRPEVFAYALKRKHMFGLC